MKDTREIGKQGETIPRLVGQRKRGIGKKRKRASKESWTNTVENIQVGVAET